MPSSRSILQLLPVLLALCVPPAHAQEEPLPAQDPKQLFEPREFVGAAGDIQGKLLRYRLLKPADFDPSETAVGVEKSRNMIAALRAAGGKPLYSEYPGVGHDSWTQTYANAETFRWLFAQRKMVDSAPSR